QVVMGDFSTLETALTSPQGRTWRLGTSLLDADHGPNFDIGDRNLFLLSLSDLEADGNGDHAAFRKCMEDYLINEAAINRQQDAIARQLLDQLASDYQTMPHEPGGIFFTDTQGGWIGFLVRYLHYVLFGLDPKDTESISLLTELHYNRRGTIHYFGVVGKLWNRPLAKV
ncbi:MAG TPA: cytochrome 450, partial [Cyanothece sp. UBA12306]|nr:cytochrome 450 [Cyanothece sp. UBA12306]